MRDRAACTVIRHPDTRAILGVSRGYDTADWGFPGGKVEPGELFPEAAKRELREETGSIVDHCARLILLGTNCSEAFETRFYAIDGGIFFPAHMVGEPFEGYVDWKQPEEMVTQDCTFGQPQLELFRHLRIL